MADEKPKVGRPSKYDPAMCEQVIGFGREGMGRAEMAARLDVTRQTLANWESAHPDFLDATTRARELSAAWWAEQGRKGIWERGFNAVAYRLQVLNRFPDDWRDRQSVEHSGPNGGPIQTQEIPDEALLQRAVELNNRISEFMAPALTPGTNGKH